MTEDAPSRHIVRIHEDKVKRCSHVFSERGYELTIPKGFRDRRIKLRAFVTDTDVEAVRDAARVFERAARERTQARRERQAERANLRPRSGTVSAIVEAQRGRKYVYLDGEFAFTASATAIEDAWLRVGDELTEEKVRALVEGYSLARALEFLDRFCGYRPRSISEARKRLERAGFETALIVRAIERRLGSAVLEDEAFARWFAEHRGVAQGKTMNVISGDLRRLGVSDEALDVARDGFDTDGALDVAAGKAARALDLTDERDRKRFVDRLTRRGFRWSDIRDTLERLAREASELDGIDDE